MVSAYGERREPVLPQRGEQHSLREGADVQPQASIFRARRGEPLVCLHRWPRTHSLGFLFDAASTMLGLGQLGAGKTMGLAAYGRACGIDPWPLFEVAGGDFRPLFSGAVQEPEPYRKLMRAWFSFFNELAGGVFRAPGADVLDADPLSVQLAWSAQAALQAVVDFLVGQARSLGGTSALCMAGGVALNCSANGRIAEPVFVPPVPHDSGVALGAAWAVLRPDRAASENFSAYLGAEPGSEWRADLDGLRPRVFKPAAVADLLMRGKVGAVVEGRAEIGPRALCHRSIIAAPRHAAVRDHVNRLKGREPWRPLSPVALRAADGVFWPHRDHLTRFMLGAVDVSPDAAALIPAVVHVDGTARPQVAGRAECPVVTSLLEAMAGDEVPPVLLNTSFNGSAEPIVNSGRDALATARRLGLDFVVIEDTMIDLR